MDAQVRIEQAMDQLSRNLQRAKEDPQAVLEGKFSGTSPSGAVTVWVDSLGRVDHIRIEPDAFSSGGEKFIMDEFMAANSSARRAAENLEFEDTGAGSRTTTTGEAEQYDEVPQSFLESGY
ncbi:YbaB/EbfC family nucleoid-associated protein [Saccharopolyspora taberi]|uniref:YbaB/EbfC family DNA-binding protein n=1 Tax=Saccharopolyspora taberi TaxID=60895 RepID=A0ABN3VKE1_9PSEU